jgi:hypothetical protein
LEKLDAAIEIVEVSSVTEDARLEKMGKGVALLAGVYRVFAERAWKANEETRIATVELVNTLINQDEGGFKEVNHGRPVTDKYLREWLTPFVNPETVAEVVSEAGPGSGKYLRRWYTPELGRQRGYYAQHFVNSFIRYLKLPWPPKRDDDLKGAAGGDHIHTPTYTPSPPSSGKPGKPPVFEAQASDIKEERTNADSTIVSGLDPASHPESGQNDQVAPEHKENADSSPSNNAPSPGKIKRPKPREAT